jgi:hypothetical protein
MAGVAAYSYSCFVKPAFIIRSESAASKSIVFSFPQFGHWSTNPSSRFLGFLNASPVPHTLMSRTRISDKNKMLDDLVRSEDTSVLSAMSVFLFPFSFYVVTVRMASTSICNIIDGEIPVFDFCCYDLFINVGVFAIQNHKTLNHINYLNLYLT